LQELPRNQGGRGMNGWEIFQAVYCVILTVMVINLIRKV
jgi:hypothetical protein